MPQTSSASQPKEQMNGLEASVLEMRKGLAAASPIRLARNTGSQYQPGSHENGCFNLCFFGAPLAVQFPDMVVLKAGGEPAPLPVQALLLHHFNTSDGRPATGRWVAFSDLPGGRVYNQAFQGYSGDKLIKQFGDQIETFRQACLAAGGQPAEIGDAAFVFQALPMIALLVTYWLGEEEFPPTAKILFDQNAVNHLPIDVCAILGSMLVSRISKAAAALDGKAK